MKILILEPFFTGSHKKWTNEFQFHSKHEIEILSLPGRFWKWRMHGGAITLHKYYEKLNFKPDLIIASDMLNLPIFKSLMKSSIPIILYFHENQFTYPWSKNDPDVELQRDKHYGFINYSSALIADKVLFNSQFHLNSFFHGMKEFLTQFPDYKGMENIKLINSKSHVLYLGLDLKKFKINNIEYEGSNHPTILWNHRWEYDKNPELFFKILKIISQKKINFKLVVIGQDFNQKNPVFKKAKKDLKKHIIQFGHVSSFEEYASWLWKADIIPVTSNQDFFGASIMEAVFCNTIPLLPNRLSYPELFDNKNNPNNFYSSNDELLHKLEELIKNHNYKKNNSLSNIALKYDWRNMIIKYDKTIESFLNEINS